MTELKAYDPSAIAARLGEMEFSEITRFDSGQLGVFWSEAGGPSPWEMHPDCDEMLQILKGSVELMSGAVEAVRARERPRQRERQRERRATWKAS